jgi:CheY-like chemotaxis protein
MRAYLSRLLGAAWRVQVAGDGEQALQMARESPPDLLLADVMMPHRDGLSLLRAVRNDPALAPIPVVLLTARAGEETAIEGLLAGADDYVVKPFSARELAARVAAQLDLAQARRHAAELNAFRIRLSDALRALDDPREIQRTACRMIVEQLGADRARYVELDEENGEFVTSVEHNAAGMPPALGRYAMAAYAPLSDAIHAGRRLAIGDTQTDPEVAPIRDALAALHIHAQIVVPLMRDGHSVAAFAVHQQRPRNWTDDEVGLAAESAGRAWAEVSRTRAEAALRDLNAQLGETLQALARDTGTLVWTTDADGRLTDDSSSWREFTGESLTGCVGSNWREAVHPDDRTALARAWSDAVQAVRALDWHCRLNHAPSGSWHKIRMHAIPRRRPDRPLQEWLVVATDLGVARS